MEENLKIVHIKNLNKIDFSVGFNLSIDVNANVKTVLNVNSYIYDQKCECGNGKAIIGGKICVKVLYIDTDNITNIISDQQSFSETYLEDSITTDTYLNLNNSSILNTVSLSDGNLKINCEVSLSPVAYLNLPLTNDFKTSDSLVTKKTSLTSSCIKEFVNTKFEHTTNFETRDNINKILCSNSYFSNEKYVVENGYVIVEGKLTSSVLYETNIDDNLVIKELRETQNIKYDVELNNLLNEDKLDLSYIVDNSLREISTELEDGQNVIIVKDTIKVCGLILRKVETEIVDDLFSLENEIETSRISRALTKRVERYSVCETISNEISLNNDEPAIDEVIANLNINPEITNTYVKDNNIYVEGVVSSNLTYIDENKELKHKEIEIPFIINTKIQSSNTISLHNQISVVDTRVKIKRGTIIDVEYSLFINLCVYEQENCEMLNTYNIGKQLDFSKYDYQIFIAKADETLWQLCKRIKIAPNEIHKYNKNLPPILQGGERIVIKR